MRKPSTDIQVHFHEMPIKLSRAHVYKEGIATDSTPYAVFGIENVMFYLRDADGLSKLGIALLKLANDLDDAQAIARTLKDES